MKPGENLPGILTAVMALFLKIEACLEIYAMGDILQIGLQINSEWWHALQAHDLISLVFLFFFLTSSPGKMKTVAYFVCVKKLVLRWYIMQIRWRKIVSSKNRMGDQYWEFRPIWISCVSITASWYMTHMFHELMLKVLTHPSEISPVACNKGQVEGKTRVQITVDIRTY